MTAQDLFHEAKRLGLRLEPHGDKLAVIPANLCTPEFAETLKAHKVELLHWLNRPPRPGWGTLPPVELPLVSVEPRPTPHDRLQMIDYLRQQGAERPCPLAAWLVRRESAYYDGPGRKWDCSTFAYAASRDAACWQLNRGEREVLDLLAGLIEASAAMPLAKPGRQ